MCSPEQGWFAALSARRTVLCLAKYSFGVLTEFRARVDKSVSHDGVVLNNVDEVHNIVAFQLDAAAAAERVRSALETPGIPADAVDVRVTPRPCLGSLLTDLSTHVGGGLQIGFPFSTSGPYSWLG